MLELCETFLPVAGVDLRDRDACLDRWIVGIDSHSFFELLQREPRLAVSHIGIAEQAQRGRICRQCIDEWFEIIDSPRCGMLLQRGGGDQPRSPAIAGNKGEIFSEDIFCLLELAEHEFRRSLEIVARPVHRKDRADAIEDPIRRGVLLLLGEFQRAQVVRYEVVRADREDRIEILVRSGEFVLRYVDVGAVQASQPDS